jgi:hypothetical protein
MRAWRQLDRLIRGLAALAFLAAAPASGQQISAGKTGADETAHLQRIANNKKRHYACAVSIATKRALETKASTEVVAAAALRGCREFELEYKRLLENGAPTTNGHVAAVSSGTVAQLLGIRKRELRPSIVGAIKEVR